MSTDAKEILKSVRSLPLHEQLEVLQGLAQSLAQVISPWAELSATFWSDRTLDELASERQTPIANDLAALAIPTEAGDESADEMIAYLYHQRQLDHVL
jgi:hypothetical protein